MTTTTAIEGGATHVACTRCGSEHSADQPHRLSPCCDKPLYARYDLARLRPSFRPAALSGRAPNIWRYAEVLPVRDPRFRLTLGEGFTPLLDTPRLAAALGMERVLVKDESQNPTGSFKARGLAMAIARARELGIEEVAIPSAGNAASATAAYAAAAGITAHVAVPSDTPRPILEEIRAFGADLMLVDGLITDAAKVIAEGAREHGWFDLSTLKEPYRVEGKKTMGYELFEQMDGRLPDAIVYPTGGGTGLVGMWKAFDEMQQLGWIGAERPRMICVQAEGCAPVVRAFESGSSEAEPWADAYTNAYGLRVPRAVGDFLMLDALRTSQGDAIAVRDSAMTDGVALLGRTTGIFASAEGGATVAAVAQLLQAGRIRAQEDVVLFNTGSGLKYL